MSPNGPTRSKKATIPDNVYTIILAIAFCAVLATAALVAYKCHSQYGTFFQIPV
ncbi:MAG: hypothetical protein PVJ60_06985 [Phycisphaerales bacterium]|jgi:hypothetical protein